MTHKHISSAGSASSFTTLKKEKKITSQSYVPPVDSAAPAGQDVEAPHGQVLDEIDHEGDGPANIVRYEQ
jgi:hypothetical protein